jgi:FAD:protein FMN transferase
MGTVADLAVVHQDRTRANRAVNAAIAELQQVERWMTRFDGTSDVGRANRAAAADATIVSPATAAVVIAALTWADVSGGAFDPCLARTIEAWDVARRSDPPAPDTFVRLAGRRLHRALDVDTWRGQPAVRFTDPDVGLDLGGIAKGYGVDRAVAALREHGISDAIVNVGGDLYAIGSGADGDPWRVGVRAPDEPDGIVSTLEVRDRAVATSGSYLQYFESRGRRYHHLIDPDTAEPRVCAMKSLTVSAGSCMAADAAATALFGATTADTDRLLTHPAVSARVELVI